MSFPGTINLNACINSTCTKHEQHLPGKDWRRQKMSLSISFLLSQENLVESFLKSPEGNRTDTTGIASGREVKSTDTMGMKHLSRLSICCCDTRGPQPELPGGVSSSHEVKYLTH